MDILKTAIIATLSIAATSCYQDFTPDIDVKPKLSINSFITAGEPIKVTVGHTWLYTDYVQNGHYVEDASVVVKANGQAIDSTYIPLPGDKIEIMASHPEYGEATAEVTVPQLPSASVEGLRASLDSYWEGAPEGYDMLWMLSFTVKADIKVRDSGTGPDYYAIGYASRGPERHSHMLYSRDEPIEVSFFGGVLDYDAEPIFGEHIEAFEAMMATEDTGFAFFTDRQFSGADYTMHLKFDNGSYYVNLQEWDEDALDCAIIVSVHAVSESYYSQARFEWQDMNSYLGDLSELGLSEPIWGYSNVSTGAGVVAAQSVSYLRLPMADFLREWISDNRPL